MPAPREHAAGPAASGRSVWYSPEGLVLQRLGGVSRSFCEVARALDEADELGWRPTIHAAIHSNVHLRDLARDGRQHGRASIVAGRSVRLPGELRKTAYQWSRIRFDAAVRAAVEGVLVVHDTGHEFTPRSPVPVVVTVHDLINDEDPAYRESRPAALAAKELAIDRATRIVVPSVATRDALLRVHRVDEDRVDVIPHGLRLPPPGRARSIADRYVLHVGSRGRYKDFPTAIRAFASLRRSGYEGILVNVGGGRLRAGEVALMRELGLGDELVRVLSADDEALSTLYAFADALVVPSRIEGFGIPILEAMSLGCPVACMHAPGCSEVAGDAAMLAEVGDDAALAGNLARLVGESSTRGRLVAAGLARAAGFTWANAAARYAACYAAALDSGTRRPPPSARGVPTVRIKDYLGAGIHALTRLRRRLPADLDRAVFHAPRGTVESLDLACRAGGGECVELREERPASLLPAIDLAGIRWRELDSGAVPTEGRPHLVGRLVEGRVLGRQSTVLTRDGDVVLDASPVLTPGCMRFGAPQDPQMHRALRRYVWLPAPRRIDAPIVVAGCAGAGNYYHWLLEALPRLLSVREAGLLAPQAAIAIPRSRLPAITESLDLLGIDPARCIPMGSLTQLASREVVASTAIGHLLGPTPDLARSLRDAFLGAARPFGSRRLLVLRRGSRRIGEETALVEALRPFGFEPVRLETLSFVEQIGAFADAEAVVAPHGAGLSNLVWCRRETRVLELLPANYLHPCFRVLAAAVGLQHEFVIAPVDEDGALRVDVEVVRRWAASLAPRAGSG